MANGIVIFSRSGESEYRWLMDAIRDQFSVSSFLINNRNFSMFCEELYRCSVGILYHSRNRGRVNITDVTDSLYDGEVKTMNEMLGRGRVIVVIDDLDDSSDDTKNRILGHQPTLRNLTQDVFFFTTEDKANAPIRRQKVEAIKRIIARNVKREDTEDEDLPVQDEDLPVQGSEKKMVISLLACVVFWHTYYYPTVGNGVVAVLWLAVMRRMFSISVSRSVLPLATQRRFALCCAVTALTVYDTYRAPSAFNVAVSGMWMTSCMMYAVRRTLISGSFGWVLPFGVVVLTFWRGWRQLDADTIFQKMFQCLLCSPAILSVEGI